MQRAGTIAAQRTFDLSPHLPRHRICTLGEGTGQKDHPPEQQPHPVLPLPHSGPSGCAPQQPHFTGEETEALREHPDGGLHNGWAGMRVSQEEE